MAFGQVVLSIGTVHFSTPILPILLVQRLPPLQNLLIFFLLPVNHSTYLVLPHQAQFGQILDTKEGHAGNL